ncbi:hypothetical protein JCM10908_006395 [Rhodotorula pacifica]|uniref:AAR2 splicing factor family protein n=1 Tax=Rhodotorula pacifica TaxID=1495444 RepID=UPI003178B722
MDPAQRAAHAAYQQLGFFVLEGLPPGSEFGLDTLLWRTERFKGVKFIPPGLHLFVFSAAPSSTDEATARSDAPSSVGTRHGILRFFHGNECVAEEWDNAREELKSAAGTSTKRKRRRVVAGANDNSSEETVASPEYLKSLDASLAPYPQEDISKHWPALTSFISEKTLARVVGLEASGSAHVDALTATADDAAVQAAAAQAKKQVWGKPRPEAEAETPVDVAGEEGGDAGDDPGDLLEFVKFDEKRSWPPGAAGEELTRWSKDKSWQLSQLVGAQLDGEVKELLGELQLSFVLFSLIHNFAALGVYRSLFALICRASVLALPPSDRPASDQLPSPLLTTPSLPLFASFLSSVHAQIAFLEPDFFSTQLPSLEQHLLDSLAILLQSLSDAQPAWTRMGAQDSGAASVWREVVTQWDALARTSMAKFGWDLGVIRGSHTPYTAPGGRVERDDGEVDLEDLDSGDEAPIILDENGDEIRASEL